MNKKKGFHYGYLIVAAGIAMQIGPSALAFSCAGIFYTPVSEALNVGRGVFALYMTFVMLSMAITLPFAGKILASVDSRICLSVSTVFVGVAIIAMSFYTQVWMFYISGVFIGVGEAFLIYLAVPTLLNRWFKKNVGFFLGLCMAFTGIGGVIFNPVGGAIIASGPEGWRTAYLVFGVLSLVIALPFTLFVVRDHPSDKGLLPYGDDGEAAATATDAAPKAAVPGVSASKAMRSPVFYAAALFCAFVNLCCIAAQYFPSYASSFADTAPEIAALAAILASAAMAGQAIGKVLLGIINDRKMIAGILTGLLSGIVSAVAMWFVPLVPAVILGGAFLFGIFYASGAVSVPLLAREVFGLRDYTNIYARIAFVGSMVSAAGPPIWGFIIDGAGFDVFWIAVLLGLILALPLSFFALQGSKRLWKAEE
jgi:MFS family permease